MTISYLKWAGGKSIVSSILLGLFTKTGRLNYEHWKVTEGQTYHEWFGGSMSMYFHLKEAGFIADTARVVLNDFSASLINSARVVQSVEPSKICELSTKKH